MIFSKGSNIIRQKEFYGKTSPNVESSYYTELGKDSNIYVSKSKRICRYCRENGDPINAFIKRIDAIEATGKKISINGNGTPNITDFTDETLVYITRNDGSIMLVDNLYADLLRDNHILFRVTDNGIMWIISENIIYASLDGFNWQYYEYPKHQLYSLYDKPDKLKIEHIYTDYLGQTKIVLAGSNIKIEGRIYCSFNFTTSLNLTIHIEF